jgi:cation:H+ antiporter
MSTFGLLLLIAILFYFLGRSADIIVKNLKLIAKRVNIDVSFLGFILGFFTSFPELAIAVNAMVSRVPTVSYGNLIGGIPAILGLVLGLNVVFSRSISTHGARRPVIAIAVALMLPLVLALDGRLGLVDALILIAAYASIMLVLYLLGDKRPHLSIHLFHQGSVVRPVFMMLAGALMVLLLSNLIMRFTTELIKNFEVSPFLVGLLLFGVGTNLPEIMISFRAWRNHNEELSISNLIGSAMSNVLIVGLVALQVPIIVSVNLSFYLLIAIMSALLIAFVFSYRSGGKFTRMEGMTLLVIYFVFVASQVLGLAG